MRITQENMRHTLAALVNNSLKARDIETVRNYLAGVRAIRLLIDGEQGADRLMTQVHAAIKKIERRRNEVLAEIEGGSDDA